jgi:hypothetical protein
MKKIRTKDVIGLMLIIGVIAMAYHKKEDPAPIQGQYKMGQIILPDYAHDDTLIVVNAPGLNREIVNASTDWEIWGTLHRHCATAGEEQAEYGVNIAEEGYQVIDRGNQNSITVPWTAKFDSLMLEFNR